MWRRPWRRGGPARTSGSRWRPKPIRLRFSFGLQEQAALKRAPRLHTESDLGTFDMDGKIISRRFQWLWSKAQIHPESTGIVCEVGVQNLFRCCITVFGPMARVSCWSPIGARPGGHARPKPLLVAAATIVRLGFCLDSFCQEQLLPFIGF